MTCCCPSIVAARATGRRQTHLDRCDRGRGRRASSFSSGWKTASQDSYGSVGARRDDRASRATREPRGRNPVLVTRHDHQLVAGFHGRPLPSVLARGPDMLPVGAERDVGERVGIAERPRLKAPVGTTARCARPRRVPALATKSPSGLNVAPPRQRAARTGQRMDATSALSGPDANRVVFTACQDSCVVTTRLRPISRRHARYVSRRTWPVDASTSRTPPSSITRRVRRQARSPLPAALLQEWRQCCRTDGYAQ